MATDTFRKESKKNFYSKDQDKPTNEQIQIGCLQRIADATELMAKRYQELISERDRYKKWYNEESEENQSLRRSNASLKGHITRLKNKLNQKNHAT